MNSLVATDVYQKIQMIEESCQQAMTTQTKFSVSSPGRSVQVLHPKLHPAKKGFSTAEGQARMIHDLANIELQAMELGLRTLFEFPDAPEEFRQELCQITLSEAQHLQLCLQGLEDMGYQWGDWPVHLSLWQAVSSEDCLLNRILIVHRYLEGSGLDAGATLIKRLEGTSGKNSIQSILKVINQEEIGHVHFGSEWYFKICRSQNLDPETDFNQRMNFLRQQIPKRVEPVNHDLRKKAGFTDREIKYLEDLRLDFLKPQATQLKVIL